LSKGYNFTFNFRVSYQPGFNVYEQAFDYTIYPAHLIFTKGSEVPVASAGGKFLPKYK